MIRAIEIGDIDEVADAAHAARLLAAGGEPDLWSPSAAGYRLHPLLLRRLLDDVVVGLVDERSGRLRGAVIAREVLRPMTVARDTARRSRWVVEEFVVWDAPAWSTTGRALLVASAARAHASGIDEVLAPCATRDAEQRNLLHTAGLRRLSWIRHRRVGRRPETPPSGVRSWVPADDAASRSILAVTGRPDHGWIPSPASVSGDYAALVLDDGDGPQGLAVLAGSVPPPPGYAPDHRTLLITPAGIGPDVSWDDHGSRLLRGIEWLAAARGDEDLAVPCDDSTPELDRLLESNGYTVPLEWWSWGRPRRVLTRVASAPH